MSVIQITRTKIVFRSYSGVLCHVPIGVSFWGTAGTHYDSLDGRRPHRKVCTTTKRGQTSCYCSRFAGYTAKDGDAADLTYQFRTPAENIASETGVALLSLHLEAIGH